MSRVIDKMAIELKSLAPKTISTKWFKSKGTLIIIFFSVSLLPVHSLLLAPKADVVIERDHSIPKLFRGTSAPLLREPSNSLEISINPSTTHTADRPNQLSSYNTQDVQVSPFHSATVAYSYKRITDVLGSEFTQFYSDLSLIKVFQDRKMEFLVGLTQKAPIEDIIEALSGLHIDSIEKIPTSPILKIRISESQLSKLFQLRGTMKGIEYIEPDFYGQGMYIPNDPSFGNQWGLPSIGVDYAWNYTQGDSSVIVAILDTGVDYTHPDLQTNYLNSGFDWVNLDSDPNDDHGHGTNVAGVIVSEIDNNLGIAGIANIGYFAEKVLDSTNVGSISDTIQGINHAVLQGADIIHISWGTYGYSTPLKEAIENAIGAGVVVVAAVGNDGITKKMYPAAYDGVFAVGGIDNTDTLTQDSNFGDWMTVVAPGENILTTSNGGGYEYRSGTSVAAPYLTGSIALLLTLRNNLSVAEIESILITSADDLGDAGYDETFGWGKINADRMVRSVIGHNVAVRIITPRIVPNDVNTTMIIQVFNSGIFTEYSVKVYVYVNDSQAYFNTTAILLVDESVAHFFEFEPPYEGFHNISVEVYQVPGETILQDNDAETIVRTTPQQLFPTVGDVMAYNFSSAPLKYDQKWEVVSLIGATQCEIALSYFDHALLVEIPLENFTLDLYTRQISGIGGLFQFWVNTSSYANGSMVDIYQTGDRYGEIINETTYQYYNHTVSVWVVETPEETLYYENNSGVLIYRDVNESLNLKTLNESLLFTNIFPLTLNIHNLGVHSPRPIAHVGQETSINVLVGNTGSFQENVRVVVKTDASTLYNQTFLIPENDYSVYSLLWQPTVEELTNLTIEVTNLSNVENFLHDNLLKYQLNISHLVNYSQYYAPFRWRDAKTNGVPYSFTADEDYKPIPLPFNFTFYGVTFDQLFVTQSPRVFFDLQSVKNVPEDYPDANTFFDIALMENVSFRVFTVYVWELPDAIVIEYVNVTEGVRSLNVGTLELILSRNGSIFFQFLNRNSIAEGLTGLNFGYNLSYSSRFVNEYSLTTNFTIHFTPVKNYEYHNVAIASNMTTMGGTNIEIPIPMTISNKGTRNESTVQWNIYINDTKMFGIDNALGEELNTTVHRTYLWTPSKYGIYNITVVVRAVTGEIIQIDNKVEVSVRIFGIEIITPSSQVGLNGSRVDVSFETDNLNFIEKIEVLSENDHLIQIDQLYAKMFTLPMFEIGTHTLNITVSWFGNITSRTVHNVSYSDVWTTTALLPGYSATWQVNNSKDEILEEIKLTFTGMSSPNEIDVILDKTVYVSGIPVLENYTGILNILNGYLTMSQAAGLSPNFFYLAFYGVDTTLTVGSWNTILDYSGRIIWNEYNLSQYRGVYEGQNVLANIHDETGLLLSYEDPLSDRYTTLLQSNFLPPPEIDPPKILTRPADLEISERTQDVSITWEVYDQHPNWLEILVNGELAENRSWKTTNAISISVDTAKLGVYNYSLLIYDLYLHYSMDSVLVEIINIPDPPSVVLLSPQSGETYSSSPITIRWQASDPDHDALKSSLFYWDGEDWVSIDADLTVLKYSWDIQDIPSGAFYRVRVVVSDGFLIGMDELSSPFSIEKSQGTGIEVIWIFLSIFMAAISKSLVLGKRGRTSS